jgi:hypothetical protein
VLVRFLSMEGNSLKGDFCIAPTFRFQRKFISEIKLSFCFFAGGGGISLFCLKNLSYSAQRDHYCRLDSNWDQNSTHYVVFFYNCLLSFTVFYFRLPCIFLELEWSFQIVPNVTGLLHQHLKIYQTTSEMFREKYHLNISI